MLSKKCIVCSKRFFKKTVCPKSQWLKSRFCSNNCSGSYKRRKPILHLKKFQFKKGNIPWIKGKGTGGIIYKKPYLKYKKLKCDFCGFMPVNMCQLDVDHIDGNHRDNNPKNLQTLCANCHRLKTFTQRDGIFKK